MMAILRKAFMVDVTKSYLGHRTTRRAGRIIEVLIIRAMKIVYLASLPSQNIDQMLRRIPFTRDSLRQ